MAPAGEPTTVEKMKKVLDEMGALDEAFVRAKADIVASAGGEARLSPEMRERLNKLDLMRENMIADKFESFM